MTIDFALPPVVWSLLAASVILGLGYALWQWHRARVLTRHAAACEEAGVAGGGPLGVSVIVDGRNEIGELRHCLPHFLHQDYPRFEVIVVAGDQNEAASDTLSEFRAQFDNLKVTFTPRDSRALSPKKLALMLGIKASQYPVVLTTTANCRPSSERWLSLMMSRFEPGVDVVLGYSHYRYSRDRGPGRFYRVFDTVSTGAQWLVSAITGHPYRGTSDNLAYRREVFDAHKGFSELLHLQWGDDDVWVSRIATAANTRVQLARESQLHAHYDHMSHAHSVLKMRRDFTSSLVRRWPRVSQSLASLAAIGHLATAIAAVALQPTSPVVIVAALLSLLLTWPAAIAAVRHQCRVLGAPQLLLSVPLFALWRPVVNCFYSLQERRHRRSNYTIYG